MGKNAVNIGQHYFHNEDLSEANVDRYSRHYYHNVVKIEGFPDFSFEL